MCIGWYGCKAELHFPTAIFVSPNMPEISGTSWKFHPVWYPVIVALQPFFGAGETTKRWTAQVGEALHESTPLSGLHATEKLLFDFNWRLNHPNDQQTALSWWSERSKCGKPWHWWPQHLAGIRATFLVWGWKWCATYAMQLVMSEGNGLSDGFTSHERFLKGITVSLALMNQHDTSFRGCILGLAVGSYHYRCHLANQNA